uniref:nicotinate-nucleotide--dimethylbenzimidazole phosphoribosyltransferase n=1 Tax=Ezakiella massiliensis TaxID=1852374 RepID=UPI00094ED892|nr:nicotinate-nucleotide--dimethylbenzimidazole phosphoribosyltransferase [Ezakiella massiliensis]
MQEKIEKIIEGIRPVEKSDLANKEWNSIAHPLGSLGDLEKTTIKIANIQGRGIPSIKKRVLICMASDNGVIAEGISSGYPDLTSQLVMSMMRGKTGCASLCRDADMQLIVVDLGTRNENEIKKLSEVVVEKRRINPETKNFATEPAMTMEELFQAITTGFEMVDKYPADIYGTGELGIGNTTTSSAIMAALFDLPANMTVGLGGGLDDEGYRKKIRVIDQAIEKYDLYNKDVFEILRTVGGYDIGGLVGVFLKAAYEQKPIIIDGFISAVAAAAAVKLNVNVKDYLIPSHMSAERQMKILTDFLGVNPPLFLSMRLGEGTGCPLMIKMIDSGIYALENMGRWDDVYIDDVLYDIREDQ